MPCFYGKENWGSRGTVPSQCHSKWQAQGSKPQLSETEQSII